ncbi:MAG: 5-oxoprolinase, partial [Nitrospirae bacterium]
MSYPNKFRFSIDRGGTFTDIYAEIPREPWFMTMKLLSEDPARYDDASAEGIRRIIEKVTGKNIPADNIDPSQIQWIRMGTTVATNALLERKGVRTVLLITKGFGDLLKIGYQNRPDIFDLSIKTLDLLYEEVIEVDERVRIIREDEEITSHVVEGITGEKVEILRPLDEDALYRALYSVYKRGINSVSVVLMHAYTFPRHEKIIGRIAKDIGFKQISLSHEVMPNVKIVQRGDTTTVDAYLTPHITRYIESFRSKFIDGLRDCKVFFMQSYGGLVDASGFRGSNALLSGPAGGVVGYAATAYEYCRQPVIGFDMGGTSTDVSRYAGEYELTQEMEISGVRIQTPQLHIKTVAAGGGSKLLYQDGRFIVGPESTGADPGPVCYRKGGELSITDANLALGRINPEFFPKIFGPNGDQPLDHEGTIDAFSILCERINRDAKKRGGKEMSPYDVAYGFIEVANETMARAIREISIMRGYDIEEHALACFGGASGQHACSLAKSLGIKRVFIHRFAGILSAYGLGLADVVKEKQIPCSFVYHPSMDHKIEDIFKRLREEAILELTKEGFYREQISINQYLSLRYRGTATQIMVKKTNNRDYEEVFRDIHMREYGFVLDNRDILLDAVRIRAVASPGRVRAKKIEKTEGPPEPIAKKMVYFKEGWIDTPFYLLERLRGGDVINGPSVIIQDTSTIVVEPKCKAFITPYGDIDISIGERGRVDISEELDPVRLSVFNNLFMSIAEQMGRTLQRTAISTNIKERLDFSCAVFDRDGNIVANAPHIPVHLGSMAEAVKGQIKLLSGDIKSGDVLLTNAPYVGGTHLPDITVITPVFQGGVPVFFVASRGHHADIGGISPGSIPPFSTSIEEEGLCIESLKIVEEGHFKEEELKRLLSLSGCRNIKDSISDIKAQIAANKKGVELILSMIEHYGLDVVHAYMKHIQDNAEETVLELLRSILDRRKDMAGEDFLDDGSSIRVRININEKDME